MDQIKTGVVLNKQFPSSAYVRGTRFDPSAQREEPIFDALLAQSKSNYADDGVRERTSQLREDRDGNETGSLKKQEKDSSLVRKEEETETCDVAREVATSQIVWNVEPNAEDLKVPDQIGSDVVLHQSVNTFNTEGVRVQDRADMMLTNPEAVPESIKNALRANSLLVQNRQPTEYGLKKVEKWYTSADKMDVKVLSSSSDEIGDAGEALEMEMPVFQNVESTPIKVAEAPERTEQNVPVENQVAQKLTNLLSTGETTVQIQLEPVELGKLTIELTRSSDGTLSVLLDAESSQTRNLLEKSIGTLQDSMLERGQKIAQIIVEHNEESQRQEQQRNDLNNGGNGQQQQQEQRRNDRHGTADFMQQLRLGLIPLEEDEEEI